MRTKLVLFLAFSLLAFTGCHGVIAVGKQKVTLPAYEPGQSVSKKKQYPEKINLSVSVDKMPRIKSGFVLGNKKDGAGRKQGYIYTPDKLGEWIGAAYKTELSAYGYGVNLCSRGDLKSVEHNGVHIDVLGVKQHHRSINTSKMGKVTQVGLQFDIYHKGELVDSFKESSAGVCEYHVLKVLLNTTDKLEKSFLVTMKKMTKKSIPLLDNRLQNANMLTLRRYAQKAKDEVERLDRDLIKKAKTVVRIKNKTGFADPVIDPSSLRVSMSREVGFPLPDSILVTDPQNPSAALMAEIDNKKKAYLATQQFNLSCGNQFNQGPYNGFITCPANVRAYKGRLTPKVTVTLTSLSIGLRFPEYKAADKRLKATITNGQLYLANLTDKYMEIRSVAVYGGKEIQENEFEISLSPYMMNKEPISLERFASYNKDLKKLFTFKKVRRQDVSGRKVKFGLAVKYRVGSGGNFETFHSTRDVPLVSLVSP